MKLPKYIKRLNKNGDFMSVMTFHHFRTDIFKYFDEKKLERVYEKSHIHLDGDAIWSELIYKTNQSFYLFLENKSDDSPIWNLTIFYKPNQFDELVFFIRQVLRQLRDESLVS